jgi:hypothetical protein
MIHNKASQFASKLAGLLNSPLLASVIFLGEQVDTPKLWKKNLIKIRVISVFEVIYLIIGGYFLAKYDWQYSDEIILFLIGSFFFCHILTLYLFWRCPACKKIQPWWIRGHTASTAGTLANCTQYNCGAPLKKYNKMSYPRKNMKANVSAKKEATYIAISFSFVFLLFIGQYILTDKVVMRSEVTGWSAVLLIVFSFFFAFISIYSAYVTWRNK